MGEAARSLFADAQADARANHRRGLVHAPTRSSDYGRPTATATTSWSTPTKRAARRWRRFHTLRQQLAAPRGPRQRGARRFRRAAGERDCRTISAPSPSPPASARRPCRSDSNAPTTTTPRSWLKALADRLAEAFAERLHQRVRREFWGYAPDETLATATTDRRTISRHPPGARLSGQPDHTEKATLFRTARRRGGRSASS